MKKFLKKFKHWFLCTRFPKGEFCEWEFRPRADDEECGANIGVRHCKFCNRKQYAYYVSHIEWRDR